VAHAKGREPVQPAADKLSAHVSAMDGHDQSHGSLARSNEVMPPRLVHVIGPVLRYGSIISSTLILVGLALTVLDGRLGGWQPFSGTTGAYPLLTASPDWILRLLATINPESMINLGILVLIATPITRVASTVAFFLIKRDLPYLAITLYVLLVLLAGFLIGATG